MLFIGKSHYYHMNKNIGILLLYKLIRLRSSQVYAFNRSGKKMLFDHYTYYFLWLQRARIKP